MELRHLVDVVVFPTTGSFPLAAKLQGGDYDGDTVRYTYSADDFVANMCSSGFAGNQEL